MHDNQYIPNNYFIISDRKQNKIKPTLEIKTRFGQCPQSWFLRYSVRRFFASGFFHESVSPPLKPFWIFSKIRGDTCKSRWITGINDTGELPPVSTTPAAKLLLYQQHRRHFCHRYQWHRRQILPPVSLVLLIMVANLPPLSTIPAANNGNNIRLPRPKSELEGKNVSIS